MDAQYLTFNVEAAAEEDFIQPLHLQAGRSRSVEDRSLATRQNAIRESCSSFGPKPA